MRPVILIFSAFIIAAFLLITCQQQEVKTEPNVVSAPGVVAVQSKPMTNIQWIDSAKNLGKVKEGEKIEISYRFRNTGNEMLIINNIVVSCGCTVAEKPEAPIAPGAEGAIKATFDTKGRVGTNHKTMAVYTNTKEAVSTVAFEVEVLANK
jgi:Protein of unknown function (DUF1573)